MGHDGHRVFLKIIRREPVVFSTHESFEEPPRSPGHHPGKVEIIAGDKFALQWSQLADPMRNCRRNTPGHGKHAHYAQAQRD